jgi:histidyl-tRNA synthetase
MKESKKKKSLFLDTKSLPKGLEVAYYYGFSPIEIPTVTKADKDAAKEIRESEGKNVCDSMPLSHTLEEKMSLIRTYNDNEMHTLPQPVMLAYRGFIDAGKKGPKEERIGLEVLGTNKSVAEATLIKTALAILSENGIKDVVVEINSVGDRDSFNRFTKELISYFRKNIAELEPDCRQAFKSDVFSLLECSNEKCCVIKDLAPKSISFLSEASRSHFAEVLEYLEVLDVPYRIVNTVLGNHKYCAQTVFQIRRVDADGNAKEVLAAGVRYDSLSKKVGTKKDIPAIGLKLSFQKSPKWPSADVRMKEPKAAFIQLGFEAKLKSLAVIEQLRLAKVPLVQALSRDKITGQLASAEKARVPYILIMGKKEAMDRTVMVREAVTRAQETVKVDDLAEYLKRLFGTK